MPSSDVFNVKKMAMKIMSEISSTTITEMNHGIFHFSTTSLTKKYIFLENSTFPLESALYTCDIHPHSGMLIGLAGSVARVWGPRKLRPDVVGFVRFVGC